MTLCFGRTANADGELGCFGLPTNPTWVVTADTWCAGSNILNTTGGVNTRFGRTDLSLAECQAECESWAICAGFSWNRQTGGCFWQADSPSPLQPSAFTGYDCHRRLGTLSMAPRCVSSVLLPCLEMNCATTVTGAGMAGSKGQVVIGGVGVAGEVPGMVFEVVVEVVVDGNTVPDGAVGRS